MLQVGVGSAEAGKPVTFTVIGRSRDGIDWLEYEGDPDIAMQHVDCNHEVECRAPWTRPQDAAPATYTFRARAQSLTGIATPWKVVGSFTVR